MPQNTTPEKLTPQQEQVLERLLAGDTVTAAAKAVGVDRSTVHRWLREDLEFQAAYDLHQEGRLPEPTGAGSPAVTPWSASYPMQRQQPHVTL